MRKVLVAATAVAAITVSGIGIGQAGVPRVAATQLDATGITRAGAAVVDASWRMGASQGQYADTQDPNTVDPYVRSGWKEGASQMASRTTVRALVVEDGEGDRVAVVANDLYLPQTLLTRRTASLLAEHDRLVSLGLKQGPLTGIALDNLAVTASHSHSSPYYSTPSWGVWLFQDVFDLRFYEYLAQSMADAVIAAASDMRPTRMGGATVDFNEITSHSYGPQVADDGTPAGQPYSFTTGQITIVRFDDMTDPDDPQPLATWLIKGLHPEWVWGDGVLNGDITAATYRLLDRSIGGVTLWSQRETGTSGPHKGTRVHQPEDRREFQEMRFGALERAARLLAARVEQAHDQIESWSSGIGTPEHPDRFASLQSDFDVEFVAERFAPPATRPYPGVSNCQTRKAFEGNPGVPIVGLPDCGFFFGSATEPIIDASPIKPVDVYEQAKQLGVPIPESYSATAFSGVEESLAVPLQAFKLGTVGVTFSPAEQFTDQALHLESRLDKTPDNLWLGWDWESINTCTQAADTTWTCPDPRNPSKLLAPVSDQIMQRARAQIYNDAKGWEDASYTPYAEAEPADISKIKGNFTQIERPELGYDLPISVGMANDYWGYIPSYREYRSFDSYRKALSGLGPHGQDYLVQRLASLSEGLNGGAPLQPSALDLVYQAEDARVQLAAEALGALGREVRSFFEAALPPDGGTPIALEQPEDIRRFSAADFSWIGGNAYDDLPEVTVERLVGGSWETYGDQTADVQIKVGFPTPDQVDDWASGSFQWRWTANFEAFVSELDDVGGTPVTPEGSYRFRVQGLRRALGGVEPYELVSDPFDVGAWAQITIEDLRLEPDGASFVVGPSSVHTFNKIDYTVGPIDYPDSYTSVMPFIRNQRELFTYGFADPARHQQYCSRCSFRPWADTSTVASATVTIRRAAGGTERLPAQLVDGRWKVTTQLFDGDQVTVEREGVIDIYGEYNGSPSATLVR
ncbi:MAG: hypothetical protein ACLGH3_10585 [Actinomycetota bacterium]